VALPLTDIAKTAKHGKTNKKKIAKLKISSIIFTPLHPRPADRVSTSQIVQE